MDKTLAKRTNEILFVKIENDGFGLGAQRRAIARNDLPEAENAIQAWKINREDFKNPLAHSVRRKRILESGDFNLSGDRYKDSDIHVSRTWPHVPLPEVVEITQIEQEQDLIKANRKLVEIYEKKIQAKLAEIWGDEEK